MKTNLANSPTICPHLPAHLSRCHIEDHETIGELQQLADNGDCPFARSCRHCQPACRSNETPPTPMSRWSQDQIVNHNKTEWGYRIAPLS